MCSSFTVSFARRKNRPVFNEDTAEYRAPSSRNAGTKHTAGTKRKCEDTNTAMTKHKLLDMVKTKNIEEEKEELSNERDALQ